MDGFLWPTKIKTNTLVCFGSFRQSGELYPHTHTLTHMHTQLDVKTDKINAGEHYVHKHRARERSLVSHLSLHKGSIHGQPTLLLPTSPCAHRMGSACACACVKEKVCVYM